MAKGEGRGALQPRIAAWRRRVAALRPSLLALSLLALPGSLRGQDRAWWDTLPAAPPAATGWSVTSQYVPMRDGVRLAVDVYLPDGVARPLATIVEQTRYRRALRFRDPARDARRVPPSGLAAFVRAGYAVVVVDVRGTGASFGHRTTEFSPAEVRDGWEVLDWIVAQPWSNGVVGATGVSYPGTTAELMGTLGHPALKAVAPRFSIYDFYADVLFPGGIFLEPFMRAWGGMVARMDANQFDAPDGPVTGVRPVDGPHGDSLLALAIGEHARNANIFEQVRDLVSRDDEGPGGFRLDDVSPHARYDTLSRRIPIYSYGGWADGFSNASISRYLEQPSPGSRLIMGPWNHGGAWSYYPGSRPVRSEFHHLGELLRFFDHHLRGMDTGIDDEPPIHYFTTGSNTWQSAERWPVPTRDTVLFVQTDGRLTARRDDPPPPRHAPYIGGAAPDSALGTGNLSRWNTILGGGPVYYPARHVPDQWPHARGWTAFESTLLERDLTITGRPVVRLLTEGADTAQVFVYLEEVDTTGAGWIVSEGQLDLRHRATGSPGFRRAHMHRFEGGSRIQASIALLPVSHTVRRGHRIRIVVAATDRDHFKLPAGYDEHRAMSAWLVWGGALTLPLERDD